MKRGKGGTGVSRDRVWIFLGTVFVFCLFFNEGLLHLFHGCCYEEGREKQVMC